MKITEAKVKAVVKKCMTHLRKKKYELNLPAEATAHAIKCLNVYKRANGTSSAGFHHIKINTSCWQFGNKKWVEYKSFTNSPVIGEIDVMDDEDILLCLVAHEVSHFVQYTYRKTFPSYLQQKKETDRGHGECFKTIYRYLRQDLVNPTIKSKLEEELTV